MNRFKLIKKYTQIQFLLSSIKMQPNKTILTAPHNLINIISNDKQRKYYLNIIKTFKSYIGKNYLCVNVERYRLLYNISKYGNINVSNIQLEELKNMIEQQLHNMNNDEIIWSYIFLSQVDENIQESRIYSYLIRYYLRNRFEIYKNIFRIDWSMSLNKLIRKVLSRLIIREYGNKHVSYDRQIIISKQLKNDLLMQLLRNKKTCNSLIIKKLHCQIFSLVKQYYQLQMKQNIYHHKKDILFTMIQQHTNIWVIQNQLINSQNQLIRQLFIKLYLSTQGDIKQNHNYNHLCLLYLFVYHNYSKTEQDILLFLSILSAKLYYMPYFKQLNILNKLHLIILIHKSSDLSFYLSTFIPQITPYSLYQYFYQIDQLALLIGYQTLYSIYHHIKYLNLNQLIHLAFKLYLSYQHLSNILQHIINIDQPITHTHIYQLFQIITLPNISDHKQSKLILRNFLFKHLSDYHKSYPIDIFKSIYQIILNMPDKQQPFDQSGFYKNNIFQQIQSYYFQIQSKQ